MAITGTNFGGATAVRFNGMATSYVVNSATQITAAVPAGAATGPIAVTRQAEQPQPEASRSYQRPTISSFVPTSGSVGKSVKISGTNFAGTTSVKFNGVNASFAVNSSTQITAIVPSGATTGKVSVTTPSGTATSAGSFTVR